jgi:hypothetical protein
MKNKILFCILSVIIIIFTISIVPKKFQNDTFFSIALGEEILQNGISTEEELVWHEGLQFVNPRWLFDLIVAVIYNIFDFCGIYIFVIIISCIITLLYNYILNKITQKPILSFIFTIITTMYLTSMFAARGQIISFTLFLLEFYSIEELLKTNKKRYFFILGIIPFILVNTHASVYPMYFLLYIPYIAEFILSKLKLKSDENSKIIIEKRKISKLLILAIIGILAGFCSAVPGLEAHTYMFKTLGDIEALFIAEMQKTHIFYSIYFTVMLFIVIGIIAFTKTKVRVTDCFFIVGFSFISLQAIRGLYYFYIISSICCIRIINDFLNSYEFNLEFISKTKRNIILASICLIVVLQSISQFAQNLSNRYAEYEDYPIDAATYILNNIDISKMKLYNGFDIGSYLEFRGIPAFMDSRAELYTEQFNSNTTILNDFVSVTYGSESYHEIFDKYGITHALLENDDIIYKYIGYDEDWKLIYKDTTFSIYERINID